MFSFAYGKWIGNNTCTSLVDHSVIINHKQISRNRNESETPCGFFSSPVIECGVVCCVDRVVL